MPLVRQGTKWKFGSSLFFPETFFLIGAFCSPLFALELDNVRISGTDDEKMDFHSGNRKGLRNLMGDNTAVYCVFVCVCVTKGAVNQALVPADRKESIAK